MISESFLKRALALVSEGAEAGFWTDAGGRRHQALGGRSFMGTGKKTTFMITNDRPEGHPHAPTHLPKSLTAGRHAGLSIASAGGVRGGFR